jgi:hypothetical protein
VLTDLSDAMFCQKSLHESCRMGRRIDADSLICSLGQCKCNGHTVHKLGQRRLTAGLLSPGDSECSRKRSEVSSDWLPSYIKARSLTFERVSEIYRGKKENPAILSVDIQEQPLPLPYYCTMAIEKVLLKRPKQIWHVEQ